MFLLSSSIQSSRVLILDGAMGTELQRRGVDTGLPLWSANALLAHPEIVLQIHLDYLAAGADIITTNTFRTTRRTMQRANLPDRSKQLTQASVELALRARDSACSSRTLVAGSIAPLEDCYRPDLVPTEEALQEEHSELAHRLASSGVDFLLLETMNTIREASAACRAATETGLEVVVGFVCNKDGNLLSGESIPAAVEILSRQSPAAFSINCTSPRHMKFAIQHLRAATSLPVAVYGNVGNPESDLSGWEFTHDISEDQYASHARAWAAMGASIIGGCCGTTPGYIRAVASVLGK